MRPAFYKPQLDAVRFLAFFAVFNHHVLPRDGTLAPWLQNMADAAAFGLSLFFVLSAYLITLILIRERARTGDIRLRDFYARRVLRIWPLYLFGLGIGVLRATMHGVLLHERAWFLGALLLAGNLVPYSGTLMSHLWSISVEEQFYLVLPSVARLGRRGLGCAAGVFVVAANLTLIHFAHIHAELDTTVWFNSLVEFEMFAAGICLALADSYVQRFTTRRALACLALVPVLAWFAQAACHLKTPHLAASSAVTLCAGYASLACACCLFIAGMQKLPEWSPLTCLGKISFGLYVFHIPVIALVGTRLRWPAFNALCCLLFTVLLASVSYYVLEKPFLLVKRRFEVVSTRPA